MILPEIQAVLDGDSQGCVVCADIMRLCVSDKPYCISRYTPCGVLTCMPGIDARSCVLRMGFHNPCTTLCTWHAPNTRGTCIGSSHAVSPSVLCYVGDTIALHHSHNTSGVCPCRECGCVPVSLSISDSPGDCLFSSYSCGGQSHFARAGDRVSVPSLPDAHTGLDSLPILPSTEQHIRGRLSCRSGSSGCLGRFDDACCFSYLNYKGAYH